MSTTETTAPVLDHKVADSAEIELAEHEMPGLMAKARSSPHRSRWPAPGSWDPST